MFEPPTRKAADAARKGPSHSPATRIRARHCKVSTFRFIFRNFATAKREDNPTKTIFMDLKRMTEQVCELCHEVGAFIDEQARLFDTAKVEFKGPHDYVSYVDKTSEQRLTEGLSRILPEAGFLAEEGTRKEGERFTWIIDPLDGTTNFIHGVPVYAISIALLDKQAAVQGPSAPLAEGGIVLGVIYHVSMREMFYACTGEPTRCNGREARVSPMNSFDNVLLATGFPYYD